MRRYRTLVTFNTKQSKIEAQINQYLEYCRTTRHMSPVTLNGKASTYRVFVNETGLLSLTELDNVRFDVFMRTESDRGVSARTINTKVAHVIALVKYWREMGMRIPLRIPLISYLKELPPRRRFYTKEEVSDVLAHTVSDTEWLLIKIAFDTGMRISELSHLSLDQISGRRITFIGKGTKVREVYICPETCRRLMHYVKERNITKWIWLSNRGTPASVDTLRKIMRNAFIRCGYDDFFPHALRHSFGSDIQRQGADIMVIKEMMGHANVATTQKYLHGLDGQLETLFNRYKS